MTEVPKHSLPIHELDQSAAYMRDGDPKHNKAFIDGARMEVHIIHKNLCEHLARATGRPVDLARPEDYQNARVPVIPFLAFLAQVDANLAAIAKEAGL